MQFISKFLQSMIMIINLQFKQRLLSIPLNDYQMHKREVHWIFNVIFSIKLRNSNTNNNSTWQG